MTDAGFHNILCGCKKNVSNAPICDTVLHEYIVLNANNERSYKMVKFVRHARQFECLRARDVRIFRFGRDVVQIGKRWLRALESAPYRTRLGQRSQGQICFLVTSLVAHFNTPPRI